MTYDEWTYIHPRELYCEILSRKHELWLNNLDATSRAFKYSSSAPTLVPHAEVRGITSWVMLERGLLEGWLSG